MTIKNNFKKELTKLINMYSLELKSNTPDYILAEYLIKCLNNYNETINKRASYTLPIVDITDDTLGGLF